MFIFFLEETESDVMQLLLYEQESIIKWLTIIVCLCLYKCLLKKLAWKGLLHQKNIPFRNCSETPQEAPFANRPPLVTTDVQL